MDLFRLLGDIFDDIVMLIAAIGIVLLSILVVIRRTRPKPDRNPFTLDFLRDREPLITDHAQRNRILKQRYRSEKVPQDLDAIVIGSGIGGLSVAVLLSRAGKKVLVLEQHDQAGGCCHTFVDKGFEFDTGIHYVGKMKEGTETRILMDFLTDGQLDWSPIDDQYDIIAIGPSDNARRYPMVAGRANYVENLKTMFPDDHEAIDKFMHILDESRGAMLGLIMPKIFPRWIVKLLLWTGLLYMMYPVFYKYAKLTLGETLDRITDSAELKAVLGYAYGDLGPIPEQFSLPIYCSLINHYIPGAYYPVGGPSEIPLHMIPVIQSHGGQVLVDVPVTKILVNERGKVSGVRVRRNGRDIDISAPMVISDAGVSNTFRNLLPKEIAERTALYKLVDGIGPSTSCVSVFSGLEGTKEDLKLPAANIWAFLRIPLGTPPGQRCTDEKAGYCFQAGQCAELSSFSPELDKDMQRYWSLDENEAADTYSPLLFIGFPSAKDPSWESRYPGLSTCSIFALCPHHWFHEWSDRGVKRRGYEYESLKKALGQTIWKQCEMLFPQLVGKLEYFDVGTPLSNRHYLGCPSGEMYGLNHVRERVKPEAIMELRPETEIPGLYLTGQDIFTGGFAGALYGGLLCASTILHRNLLTDLKLHAKTARKRKACSHKE